MENILLIVCHSTGFFLEQKHVINRRVPMHEKFPRRLLLSERFHVWTGCSVFTDGYFIPLGGNTSFICRFQEMINLLGTYVSLRLFLM